MDFELLYQPSDLPRFVDLCGGALVPGSAAVAYVANTIDGETASKETALWLTDGGDHRRLAPADAAQSRPAVSPDGTRVAFLQVQADADDEEVTQLCVCPLAGGETTVLTSLPARDGTGRSVLVARRSVPGGGRIRRAPARPRSRLPVTRTIWRMDSMGLVDDKLTDVFVVPAAGGTPHRLTSDSGGPDPQAAHREHSWS